MHGAYAEETTDNGGLAEVVVTAEKRTENLQNVPVSIQVLDNRKLEELKVGGLDDYVKYSPSVAYSRGDGQGSNGGPGNSHVYMRGVVSGVNENHSGSQPSVGTYLDEQPVTTIDGTPDMRIYDVERIEVLEGPQGTLYGASSEAGTIRIITNKPDPTRFAGGFDLDGNHVQHGSFGYTAEGFVNVPITDFAAVRLVGWIEHDGGYIDNVAGTDANGCIVNGVRTFPSWDGQPASPVTPCPAPGVVGVGAIDNSKYLRKHYNTADTRGGRAAGRINIGDNWTVTPSIIAQSTSTEGFFGYDPAVGDLKVTHFGPENSQDNWQQSALTVEGKLSNWDLVYAGGYMKRTSHGIADYSDYSLFYDRVFGSGAYWVGDDGKPIMPQQFVVNGGYFEKWSNELRITSPADLPVKGTAGVFIQRQLHNIWQQYVMPGYGFITPYGSNPTNHNPMNPNGFSSYFSVPEFDNTIWLTDEQRVDRDKAVFAQVTWDITSQWSLTGGFRYYKFDNSLQGFYGYSANYSSHTGASQCFGPPVTNFAPCEDLNKDVSSTGWVPKGNLTYKITPDHMVYVTYSKGFRPGGVNRTSQAGIGPYQTDYLKNYELGWKTQWLDHRLRWNGALFWEDWNNFQYSFLGPNSLTIIENGGNARIKGLESELQWAATNNLMLSGNLTLLDAKLTQELCPKVGESAAACAAETTSAPFLPGGVWQGAWAPAGTRLPVAPRFKGNLVARYTFERVSGFEPFAQASFIYQTEASQSLRVDQSRIVGNVPAYGLLDLIGGVNIDNMTAQAYVTNATDRRAQLSRFAQTNPTNDNQIYVIPAQPRTVGLKFSMRF